MPSKAAKSKQANTRAVGPKPPSTDDHKRLRLSDLRADLANANKGTERGNQMLEDSLQSCGAGRSILIDRNGIIVAGNKTAEVAGQVGIEEVIVVPSDGRRLVAVQRTDLDLSDPASKARLLATYDNRTSELNLEWLPERIAELPEEERRKLWTAAELRALLGDTTGEGPAPQIDKAAELQAKWGTARGQVWEIGKHRLMCGDCTEAGEVATLMAGQTALAVLTDPPYGIDLDTDFSGEKSSPRMFGKLKGGTKYESVKGDDVPFDPSHVFRLFGDAREIFLWGADYYSERLPDRNEGSWFVWDKRLEENADRMYGSCFELCWSCKKHRREMVRVKWAGVFGVEQEPDRQRSHPTQKPVLLARWFVERFTSAGWLVVDPYLGVGGVMIAAEQLGRICYGMEIEPKYCAVTLQRLADMNLEAKLV
jgi:DNA modification methylase